MDAESVSAPAAVTATPDPMALAQRAEQAHVRAKRLLDLLGDEFAALKAQQIDAFEQLQTTKAELLATLSDITGVTSQTAVSDPERLSNAVWDGFKDTMAQCRDAHRRNELLIARQLDAIRGTIAALQGSAGQASVEVYDRLGKLSRVNRARAYNEA